MQFSRTLLYLQIAICAIQFKINSTKLISPEHLHYCVLNNYDINILNYELHSINIGFLQMSSHLLYASLNCVMLNWEMGMSKIIYEALAVQHFQCGLLVQVNNTKIRTVVNKPIYFQFTINQYLKTSKHLQKIIIINILLYKCINQDILGKY